MKHPLIAALLIFPGLASSNVIHEGRLPDPVNPVNAGSAPEIEEALLDDLDTQMLLEVEPLNPLPPVTDAAAKNGEIAGEPISPLEENFFKDAGLEGLLDELEAEAHR